MKLLTRRSVLPALFCTLLTVTAAVAQMPMPHAEPGAKPEAQASGAKKPMPSPDAVATVQLKGKNITVNYNAPSMRGRKIMGDLVPYDKIWRTGANPATMFKTETDLTIGTLAVPAGTYTIFTVPSATKWLLVINKQTGQWGLTYNQDQDLGRTEMHMTTLPAPQEVMSISFESVTPTKAQLHIKWETTDVSVPVVAK